MTSYVPVALKCRFMPVKHQGQQTFLDVAHMIVLTMTSVLLDISLERLRIRKEGCRLLQDAHAIAAAKDEIGVARDQLSKWLAIAAMTRGSEGMAYQDRSGESARVVRNRRASQELSNGEWELVGFGIRQDFRIEVGVCEEAVLVCELIAPCPATSALVSVTWN